VQATHDEAIALQAGRGIYFISGDEHPTFAHVGEIIADALGKQPPRTLRVPTPFMKFIGISSDVMGLIARQPRWLSSDKITEALAGSWMCSNAKAREQLRWSPHASFAGRMHETVDWCREAGWL